MLSSSMRFMLFCYTFGVASVTTLVLTGCDRPVTSDQSSEVQVAAASEKLGTKWGDEVSSTISYVDLQRATDTPIDESVLRYANKDYSGQVINSMSLASGKVDLTITSDGGKALPMYRDGKYYYLTGEDGVAYQLHYYNNSQQTFDVVTSVDGINVISGSSASRYGQGYVLYPKQTLTVAGFRKTQETVASFIFSKPADAYANHTDSGSINNTGIIGTAIYELYDSKQDKSTGQRDTTGDGLEAFPADASESKFAKPPK